MGSAHITQVPPSLSSLAGWSTRGAPTKPQSTPCPCSSHSAPTHHQPIPSLSFLVGWRTRGAATNHQSTPSLPPPAGITPRGGAHIASVHSLPIYAPLFHIRRFAGRPHSTSSSPPVLLFSTLDEQRGAHIHQLTPFLSSPVGTTTRG